MWRDLELAVDQLYPDCDPEEARAAAASLRPQGPLPNSQPCPLERLPDVEYATIFTREDVAVSAESTRWTAQNRLCSIEPVELPGGHSPMLARPDALAKLLLSLSDR